MKAEEDLRNSSGSFLLTHIDSLVRGSLMDKKPKEAHDFIELLANNDFGWIERDKTITKKIWSL